MSRKMVEVATDGYERESTAAVCVKTPDGSVWIPKSLLDDHDDDYKRIVIPEWLALEKSLEAYITDAEVRVW